MERKQKAGKRTETSHGKKDKGRTGKTDKTERRGALPKSTDTSLVKKGKGKRVNGKEVTRKGPAEKCAVPLQRKKDIPGTEMPLPENTQKGNTEVKNQTGDPGHLAIIKENKAWLAKNIDVTQTSVLDQLVEDDVLSQDQLAAIKEQNQTNNMRVSALMDHLWRRTADDWQKFIQCLSDHGQMKVVQRIKEETAVNDPVNKSLQHLLADTLLKFLNKIDIWSWNNRQVSVPLDDLYVELVWVRFNEGIHHKRQQRLASYTDVFSGVAFGQRGKLTYLSGEPGVGKSTITRRICVDWSNIILDKNINMTGKQREVLIQFRYVIPIILRDVKLNQTIVEVIKDQYKLEMTHAEQLCELIKHNQPSTLFILDGYDEYRETQSEEITCLAHREHFPYAHIFITSRNSSDEYFTEQNDVPEIEVSLRGFSPEGVTEYVKKSFQDSETSGEGERLLQEIKQSDDLTNLSRYPAVLLLMCCLWEETKQLANTFAGFYEDFVKYSCCRFEKRGKIPVKTKFSDILQKYHTYLMQLGQIATDGMTEDRLNLTFQYDETINKISTEAWELGFLKADHSTRGKVVTFLHKTIQEWFVAFYIVNCHESKQNELLLRFCVSSKAFTQSAMIVTFTAALGGDAMVKHMTKIIKGTEAMAEMHTSLQISYISEKRNADLVLPEVMELDITDKYPAHIYVKYLSMDGQDLKKLTVKSVDERNFRLLQHLNAPSLTWLCLWGTSSGSPCFVDESHITKNLDVTLANFPIQTLKVWDFRKESVIAQRPLDTGHQEDLTCPDLLAVIGAVPKIKQLETLVLEDTPLTSAAVHSLSECLPDTKLITLTLSNCSLTSKDFWSVVDSLPECHKLENLGLQHNPFVVKMDELSNKTELFARLRTLTLFGNWRIPEHTLEKIKQKLAITCPNLTITI